MCPASNTFSISAIILRMDQVIRSSRVVLPDGISPADIHISDGRIVRVVDLTGRKTTGSSPLRDFGDLVVMPGIVDAHVHINEPGRTEWEGFETATIAAAVGGVTTIVDMPLNSIPPTTSVSGFEEKLSAAEGKCT